MKIRIGYTIENVGAMVMMEKYLETPFKKIKIDLNLVLFKHFNKLLIHFDFLEDFYQRFPLHYQGLRENLCFRVSTSPFYVVSKQFYHVFNDFCNFDNFISIFFIQFIIGFWTYLLYQFHLLSNCRVILII